MSTDRGVLPRLHPLSYPPPTAAQSLVLVIALVACGFVLGTWTHNTFLGEDWGRQMAHCLARPPTGDLLADQTAYGRCMAAVEGRRALFALGGGLLTLSVGVAVLYAQPGRIRRGRGLRPLPPALADTGLRIEELAHDAAVPVPRVLRGPSSQRDAFTFGVPGRYAVALPPAVAVRPHHAAQFDPRIRHELAHLAHHDVAFTWLARSVWFGLVPVMLIPVAVSTARGDISAVVDYTARSLVLMLVVRLAGDALLRTREFDADLASAPDADRRAALRTVLAAAPPGRPARGLRALAAQHPTPVARVAVLDDPVLVTRPAVVATLVTAFLAATAAPILRAALATALATSGRVDLSALAAALLVGALLGQAVGLGLWRAEVFGRAAGRPVQPAPVALAVGVGLVLGHLLNLARVATGTGPAGAADPAGLLVLFLAGAGGTAGVAGLARLGADAAPRAKTARRHWITALAVGTLVYAATVWVGLVVVDAVGLLGWQLTLAALLASPVPPVIAVVAVVAAAAIGPMLRRRPGLPWPEWVVAEGPPPACTLSRAPSPGLALLVALASAAVAIAAVTAYHLLSGTSGSVAGLEVRLTADAVVAALAGVAAALGLGLSHGTAGLATGLAAGPLATLTAGAGLSVLGVAFGAEPSWGYLTHLTLHPLSLWLVLVLLGAGVSLVRRRQPVAGPAPVEAGGRAPRAGAAAVALSVVLVLAGVVPVLAAPERLAPAAEPTEPAPDATRRAARAYVAEVADPLATRLAAVSSAFDRIAADPSPDAAAQAQRFRTEVADPLARILRDARGYRAPTAEVAALHSTLLAALGDLAEGSVRCADAIDRQDTALLEDCNALLARGARQRSEWWEGVQALRGT
jgi:hypothetical protein